MKRARWLVLPLVLAVVATACGDDDDDDAATAAADTTTTVAATDDGLGGDTTTTADPLGGATTDTAATGDTTPAGDEGTCATAGQPFAPTGTFTSADGEEIPLEPGEIGITDTTITVGVYAAVDNPFSPGLAEGNRDSVYAWRDYVNQNCGLAGRTVEVVFYDTKLDIAGTEFPAAQAAGCTEVLAFVGGYELFDGNMTTMTTCPDGAGAPTGMPDIAVVMGEPQHYQNPTSYAVVPSQGLNGTAQIGGVRHLIEEGNTYQGVYLVPNDLPSAQNLQNLFYDGVTQAGVEEIQRFDVGGREENYDPFTQALIDGEANFASSGLGIAQLVRWRQNVAQLAPDLDLTWYSASVAYDPNLFAAGNEVAEGTYVTIFHLPFEERDVNPVLDAYLTISEANDYKVDSLGFQAFANGLLLGDVIEGIVAEQGPNAITRAAILDGLANLHEYDAHGVFGTVDVGERAAATCTILLQAQGGEFVRVWPEEPGTFDCSPENSLQVHEPDPG